MKTFRKTYVFISIILIFQVAGFIKNVASGQVWTSVDDAPFYAVGNGTTDDRHAIQAAIDSRKLVSLSPGKTYLINGSLEIDGKEFLYIPPSAKLLFNANAGPSAAIIMYDHGSLEGKGYIESSRYGDYTNTIWNNSDRKTAIKIVGKGNKVDIGYINGFEYGFDMSGTTNIIGNNINVGYFNNVMICFFIYPTSPPDGAVNQNYFHWNATSMQWSSGMLPYYYYTYGIYMDGNGEPNHNTFSGSFESIYVAVRLSGAFNRFLGFRAEACDYSIIINGTGQYTSIDTRYNTIFGEYGNLTGFYNTILNQQTQNTIQYAVQIYGPEGDNWLGYIHSRGYYSYSDSTLKKDIQPVDNALNKVLSLKGVRYQPKTSFNYLDKSDEKKKYYEYGFIAQDLRKVLPELVQVIGIDSLNTINYLGVIPILVEAFKEQKSMVDSLNDKIGSLEKLVETMSPLMYYSKSGENPEENEFDIEIYPNPNNGTFNLKSFNCLPNEIVIYNSYGQILFEKKNIDSNEYEINLPGLHKGTYFANIRINGQLITRKIVISE